MSINHPMMKKTTRLSLATFAVAFTGLALHAEEKKGKGAPAEPPAAADHGKGKGKAKGAGAPEPGRIFAQLDTDSSGTLSLKEFAEARTLDDASRREASEIFQKRDLNNDGEIGLYEFEKTTDLGMGGGHNPHRGKGSGKGTKGGKGGKQGA
jgi:EF-hand domain pair